MSQLSKLSSTRKIVLAIISAILLILVICGTVFCIKHDGVQNSFWSLLPPIIAICLALVTKEVYSSLFMGILFGALFATNYHPVKTLTTMFNKGFIASLSDSWNVGILIFLVVLGIIVALVNKAGGSAAYGKWAVSKIKTRRGAMGATMGLGVLIFVDDYFNCLTVGSVMRPVADTHKISRAKLAYLIDATAAPICMIAPISSWAAAVSGMVKGYNGLELFVKAIPYNFYSLFTILALIVIITMNIDFGPMRRHEINAMYHDDIYTTDARPFSNAEFEKTDKHGKVKDLILPIVMLIFCCLMGMIYTGGFFSGESFVDAFANCDASLGLSMGSFVALILTFILYLPRKVLTFGEFMECIPTGFKAMVTPILILTFAWTLGNMTGLLGADMYVAGLVQGSAAGFKLFLPAIIFLVALALAFATGTSWGTFGILIPIIVGISNSLTPEMLIMSISACLAGAVCGDHCSPISDTTIMASSGAQCDHINHVSTQLPYALLIAFISFIAYVLAGATQKLWIALPAGLILTVLILVCIKRFQRKYPEETSQAEHNI